MKPDVSSEASCGGADYDVIVVGGGHAGCEAALAAARMGFKTCLFTMNIDTIAQMSCNPAIGGLAKGHIVREIDALGGRMARTADASGIQFRVLNRSKGPAVWSLRSQNDRLLYRLHMKKTLEAAPNLDIKQASVVRIITDGGAGRKITGVVTALGVRYVARAVVITTGTFLNGLIHIGMESFPAGRAGEFPSVGLSENLLALGFKMGRLKTGTPPRLDARSIDFSRTLPQWGDDPPVPFSFSTTTVSNPQLPCHITWTSDKTHGIIRGGLDRSPLYTGRIQGTGPRYCPSIEDKVVRFSGRTRHQVFLEPDGLDTREYYANGISTSLPFDVQTALVRSIEGLEEAEIIRPGYAVEYDFSNPVQLKHTLETKAVEGLYMAGQINGTSGYEEAAGQGLMAGINAALKLQGRPPLVLGRHEAYIGVMIDDLVTLGASEPYRMFTSRAEYRLLLRNDNAEIRLKEKGRAAGLVDDDEYAQFMSKLDMLSVEAGRLKAFNARPADVNEALAALKTSPLDFPIPLEQLLKRPEVDYAFIEKYYPSGVPLPHDLKQLIETSIKYEGYIRRQDEMVEKVKRLEHKKIPAGFDYRSISGFSREALQRLEEVRPESVGQASRVPGVTPAAISLILVMLERRNKT
jgi:tRNA uridine 5-carboxymethylaminomethyl modification enzyme